MTSPGFSGRSRTRGRASRSVLVAALALGLSAAAVSTPASAADDELVPQGFADRRPVGDPTSRVEHVTPDAGFRSLTPAKGADTLVEKLGDSDVRLLQKAEARGDETVTVLLAATPGETDRVTAAVAKAGGSLGRSEEELGYVRATVPVDSVRDLAALGDVRAIDLNRSYRIPDPVPASAGAATAGSGGVAAPGPDTPADNSYLPVGETGATDFVDAHRTWDGRGVTVGILDSGVDLDHPALRSTTNGKPKVTGWFTATDPTVDGDESWRPMTREVTGPTFQAAGYQWTAPAADFRFATFWEGSTQGSELGGDVNRDGDIDDWIGILYDPEDHRIWVDSDLDNDFTDEPAMAPYGEDQQVGHFGVDDRETAVVERMPFVVDYREDVDLSPLGEEGVADFVSIGIVSGAHGTHVAGIIAGNGLFGGDMQGAAPGAQIVSARACTFAAGCTATGLAEGMIDLVLEHDVDVVNVSIGGLPALNDGSDAIAVLYDEIVEQTGTQIFVSAGNEGPGVNTVGSPSVAGNVVSVAASVSKGTWWADYGARVKASPGHLRLLVSRSRGERRPEADPRGARRGGVHHASLARGIGGAGDRLRAAPRLLHVQRHLDGVSPGHRFGGPAALGRRQDRRRRLGACPALGADQLGRPDRRRAHDRPGHGSRRHPRGVDAARARCHAADVRRDRSGVHPAVAPARHSPPGHRRLQPLPARRRRPEPRHDPGLLGQGDPARRRQPCPGAPALVDRQRRPHLLGSGAGVAAPGRRHGHPGHGQSAHGGRPLGHPAGRRPGHTGHRPAGPGHRGDRRRVEPASAADEHARLGPAWRHRVGLRRRARGRAEPGARAHRRRHPRPGQVHGHRPVRRAGGQPGEQSLLHPRLGSRRLRPGCPVLRPAGRRHLGVRGRGAAYVALAGQPVPAGRAAPGREGHTGHGDGRDRVGAPPGRGHVHGHQRLGPGDRHPRRRPGRADARPLVGRRRGPDDAGTGGRGSRRDPPRADPHAAAVGRRPRRLPVRPGRPGRPVHQRRTGIRADRGAQPAAGLPRHRRGRRRRPLRDDRVRLPRAGLLAGHRHHRRPVGRRQAAGARTEAHGRGGGHGVRHAGQRPPSRGPGAVRQRPWVGDRRGRGDDQRGHHARRGGARHDAGDGRVRPEQRGSDDRRQADRLAHQAGPVDRGRWGRGAVARRVRRDRVLLRHQRAR